jgi:hypothetical protein
MSLFHDIIVGWEERERKSGNERQRWKGKEITLSNSFCFLPIMEVIELQSWSFIGTPVLTH